MEKALQNLIERLEQEHGLSEAGYTRLLRERCPQAAALLAKKAVEARKAVYGNAVFARGLIEISNICKNDCYYCGIRRSNQSCVRYRLTPEQILACAREGYALGFRTFVMQGGEDPWFTDARRSRPAVPTAPSRCHWASGAAKAIAACASRGPTGICSATKRRTAPIMQCSIRRRCPLTTGCAACAI